VRDGSHDADDDDDDDEHTAAATEEHTASDARRAAPSIWSRKKSLCIGSRLE
jgi:hypothetical protein